MLRSARVALMEDSKDFGRGQTKGSKLRRKGAKESRAGLQFECEGALSLPSSLGLTCDVSGEKNNRYPLPDRDVSHGCGAVRVARVLTSLLKPFSRAIEGAKWLKKINTYLSSPAYRH